MSLDIRQWIMNAQLITKNYVKTPEKALFCLGLRTPLGVAPFRTATDHANADGYTECESEFRLKSSELKPHITSIRDSKTTTKMVLRIQIFRKIPGVTEPSCLPTLDYCTH